MGLVKSTVQAKGMTMKASTDSLVQAMLNPEFYPNLAGQREPQRNPYLTSLLCR